MNGHIGTEIRPRLLREAAVGNIGQWGCKLLLPGTKDVTVPGEKATANYVPAAAVIRRLQALSGFTGCKGRVGGAASQM